MKKKPKRKARKNPISVYEKHIFKTTKNDGFAIVITNRGCVIEVVENE